MLMATIFTIAVTASIPTKEIAPGVLMPILSLGHPDFNGPYVNGTEAAVALWLSSKVNGSGIDTAFHYKNQEAIGKALRESSRERSSIFLTTKIPGAIGRQAAVLNVRESLKQLQLQHVDLVLIHNPCECTPCGPGCAHSSVKDIQETWLGLQDAKAAGLTRALGVSNFKQADLEAILAMRGSAGFVPPAVNQCQMSVAAHDDATRSFSQAHEIAYESYSPFGRAGQFAPLNMSDPRIVKIAQAHSHSAYQVCMRWIVQLECLVAFSATTLAHDLADIDVFDFELSDDEMRVLASI
jgi:diketogulonate reductase-like aldo/keto reductase